MYACNNLPTPLVWFAIIIDTLLNAYDENACEFELFFIYTWGGRSARVEGVKKSNGST